MRILGCLIFLFLLVMAPHTRAAECLDVFPAISTDYGDQLNLPSYKFSSQIDGNLSGNNLAVSGGQYNDIDVSPFGSVFFNEVGADYRMKNLHLEQGATAQFVVSGDYWIENLTFEQNSTLAVIAGGTVRIYVQNATFARNARINDAGGNLIFISYGDISADRDFHFTGALYAVNDIELDRDAVVLGAVTGGSVDLGNSLSETYDPNFITNADFNGMCGPVTPIHHYEVLHDGSGSTCATEVVTIRACLDAFCSSLSTDQTTLDFLVGGDRKHTPTFTGSTTFSYPHLIPGSATFSLANESVTPDNPLVCSGNDCTITYSDTGCENSCFAYFPDTMQSHNSIGVLHMIEAGQASLFPDRISIFPTFIHQSNIGHNPCFSGDCEVTGTTAYAMSLPSFETTNTSYNIVSSSGSSTIGPTGDHTVTEVNFLTLTGTANIDFQASGGTYRIDDALFDDNAKITFNAGTYWFNELEIIGSAEVIINGPVTIYVNGQSNHFDIEESAAINVNGNAKDLAIVSYETVHLKNNAWLKAVVYSDGAEVKVESNAVFIGAVSVRDKLEISGSGGVFYEDISGVEVSGICSANPSVLELHFNFNEGSGQTITDSSGKGRNGTLGSTGGSDSNDPTWTCETSGYNLVFDASSNQYLQTAAFTPPEIGAVSFWVKVPQTPTNLQRIFGFGDGWEVRWLSGGTMVWDGNKAGQNLNMRTANPVTEVDTWVHFVFVTNADDDTWAIYKNGVLENSGTEAQTPASSAVLTLGASTWQLGIEHFDGELEDFRIYSGELTQAEITALAANTPAGCPPNHYQIIHDASGLTCNAETVTVKACTNIFDGSCTLSPEPATLDFVATGASDMVTKSIAFTGSTNVSFNYIHAENTVLSIANDNPNAPSGYVCNDNSAGSCNMGFADTGFILSNIATQTSDKPSSTVTITAVETSTETGQCQAALVGNTTISMGAKCENPLNCNGRQVSVNNGSDIPIATVNNSASTSYTNVNLDFGDSANSSATFTLKYPDAGQMKLYARYNLPDPDTGLPSGEYMNGSSNSFVVKPYGFYVDVAGNDATAADAGQDSFKMAGEDFTVQISAVVWTHDGDGDLSDNAITPNFGHETVREEVNLTHALVGPDPLAHSTAQAGTLSGDATSGIEMTNGQSAVLTLQWNEVGIFELNANLADNEYLGVGSISGQAPFVGRFYPESIWQSIESGDEGSLTGIHKTPTTCEQSWVYTGQYTINDDATITSDGAIRYDDVPRYTLTPYGKGADPEAGSPYKIKNYALGGFNKITDYEIETPNEDDEQAKKPPATGNVLLTANLTGQTLTLESGEEFLTYTFNSTDSFIYTRNQDSYLAEYAAKIRLATDVSEFTESDGATFNKLNGEDIVLAGTNVRYGRVRIDNAYGPETTNLLAPLYVEHLHSSGKFVVNEQDSCFIVGESWTKQGGILGASLNLGEYRIVDGNDGNVTPAHTSIVSPISSGNFVNGILKKVVFQATANGERGDLKWEFKVPEWLKFDWNDTGTDKNPEGEIQFGIYRGNDRIISWREIN